MEGLEIAIIASSIISTFGFIVIVMLRNSAQFQQLGVKIDAKQLEYAHKEKLQGMRNGMQTLKLAQQKQAAKTGGNGLVGALGNLANLDLDQIHDLVDKFGEMKEGAEDNPIVAALNNPIVKGFVNQLGKNKQDLLNANNEIEIDDSAY